MFLSRTLFCPGKLDKHNRRIMIFRLGKYSASVF